MKTIILALAMVAGVSQAQAKSVAAPVFGCTLNATITRTVASVEALVIRGETLEGQGVVVCDDAFFQRSTQPVTIYIQSGGIGPAFNGPSQSVNVRLVRSGVVGVDTMVGTFQLDHGVRLGLIKSRGSVLVGTQMSGYGVGAGVEGVIDNRFSIGIDVGSTALTVVPRAEVVRTRY